MRRREVLYHYLPPEERGEHAQALCGDCGPEIHTTPYPDKATCPMCRLMIEREKQKAGAA